MRLTIIALTLALLPGCAFMEDVGEATLDVAAFTIEGAGRLAEVTFTTAVEVAGAAVDAIAEQSAETTRTVAREAIDTSAATSTHAARASVRVLEDTDTRQVLELARPDGARFLRIVSMGLDAASGRHVTDVRYEGHDASGRRIEVPRRIRAALEKNR